jgi:hypothetical protein
MSEDLDVLGLLRKYENMDTLKKEAADEIERLREAGDWLWEAMSRHDNTRECPQCQDMIQAWKAVRGG